MGRDRTEALLMATLIAVIVAWAGVTVWTLMR